MCQKVNTINTKRRKGEEGTKTLMLYIGSVLIGITAIAVIFYLWSKGWSRITDILEGHENFISLVKKLKDI